MTDSTDNPSPWRLRGIRLAAIIIGLALWHLTQSMIGQRAVENTGTANAIVDQAHVLTADWNAHLNQNKNTANALLLITYGVANDFFFSGHTGIAVFGAIELARRFGRTGAAIGVGIAIFEIVTVLTLRAHYTMDIVAGAAMAGLAAMAAVRMAGWCDEKMERVAGINPIANPDTAAQPESADPRQTPCS
jgi:hypothetical protein